MMMSLLSQVSLPSRGMASHRVFGKSLSVGSILPLLWTKFRYLNAQNRLIKTVTASRGTVNETAIYPREIVKQAILNNAHTVILGHNHPGNSLKPSQADISTTKNIKAALETVNIKVLDHIIVSGDCFTSFAEEGLL
jgi:DNA repair protein RadC